MSLSRSLSPLLLFGLVTFLIMALAVRESHACCPAPPSGKPVVNADQTVILVWDAANKTEHFIRRASFKSEADDFGFLVPTPSQPELAESGNDAFPLLQKITEPAHIKKPAPSAGCSFPCAGGAMQSKSAAAPPPQVVVLDEKTVAGFHAVVLEATSAQALVGWLSEHGYAFSPQVEAWAKPYVDGGWKITALQVAKDASNKQDKRVAAAALRMSFKTDHPLFPYREPDSGKSAEELGASSRLLRIYFVAEARYGGAFGDPSKPANDATKTAKMASEPWTGNVVWSGKLRADDRKKTLELLGLPLTTSPAEWWLTELEDFWPYRVAPADVYFTRSATQERVEREPIIEYTSNDHLKRDGNLALACLMLPPALWGLRRSTRLTRLTRSKRKQPRA